MKRLHSLCFILAAPLLLSAFSIESSVDLYRSDNLICDSENSIATYQDYIYLLGKRGIGIYQTSGDSIVCVGEKKNDGSSIMAIMVYEDKMFLSVYDDTLFEQRLYRYSLSDPTNPTAEEYISFIESSGIYLDGQNLFFHEYIDEPNLLLHVVNPLDFSEEVACYSIPYSYRTMAHAGEGFGIVTETGADDMTMHVFDISDPTNIHEEYSVSVESLYNNIRATLFKDDDNAFLLLTIDYEYTAFYDITDPDSPVQLWIHEDYAHIAAIDGGVAHILFSYYLLGLDISDPSQPAELYDQPLRETWDNEAADGYVVTAGANLTVHPLTGGNLEQVAQAPLDGTLDYTACDGNYLYLGTYYQSLVQLDVRNPVPPVPTRRLMPEPTAYSGGIVSCADSTITYQYGVTDSTGGHRESTIYRVGSDGELREISPIGEENMGIPHLRGDGEMFLGEYGHLYRYAVSDDCIDQVEDLTIPDIGLCCITHYDDYLYLSNCNRILVVHAPDGGPMELTDDFDTAWADLPCFGFAGHYIFVGGNFGGVQTSVYDLTDPAQPTYVYSLSTVGPMGIDEVNGLLFIGMEECCVYDLAPLLESGDAPEFVSSFTSSDTYSGFFPLSGNRIICVDRTGVTAIQYSHPAATQDDPAPPARLALAAYPNPFNPETTVAYSLAQAGHVRLCAYNVRGQRVATLVDAPMPAGEHSAQWNAMGLPSGVYLLRLEAGGRTETTKALLLK